MKTLKLYITIAVAGLLALASCSKDETKDYTYAYNVHHTTTDGQARIKGSVTYLNAATGNYEVAAWSTIKIASDTSTKAFNQYWMADSAGTYSVKGLGVGAYYMTAQYTDQFTGAKFNAPGTIVLVNNSVDDITVNFQAK